MGQSQFVCSSFTSSALNDAFGLCEAMLNNEIFYQMFKADKPSISQSNIINLLKKLEFNIVFQKKINCYGFVRRENDISSTDYEFLRNDDFWNVWNRKVTTNIYVTNELISSLVRVKYESDGHRRNAVFFLALILFHEVCHYVNYILNHESFCERDVDVDGTLYRVKRTPTKMVDGSSYHDYGDYAEKYCFGGIITAQLAVYTALVDWDMDNLLIQADSTIMQGSPANISSEYLKSILRGDSLFVPLKSKDVEYIGLKNVLVDVTAKCIYIKSNSDACVTPVRRLQDPMLLVNSTASDWKFTHN